MNSDRIQVRSLTVTDLSFAEELSQLAGWNQTHQDWRRLLDYEPDGCFLADLEGRPAGTVTTTSYGTTLGWIGMMLVHPESRRQGVATALMQQSLNYLREKGVACIKLDATPAGQPVYERLGFTAEWEFCRWELPDREDSSVQSKQTDHSINFDADRRIFWGGSDGLAAPCGGGLVGRDSRVRLRHVEVRPDC